MFCSPVWSFLFDQPQTLPTLPGFFLFKVAVHSFVENLFRSVWGMPHCKAPHAVKYFFDFLDMQADNMKVTDPDVLHIWKTNRYSWGITSPEDRRKSLNNEVRQKKKV